MMKVMYPNTVGNIFWPVGDSLSGSCETGITSVCWLPRTEGSFWATLTPVPPSGPWPSDTLGLWRLWPKINASSESLRPPGECMDPLRTELHWGVLQSFLHTVTMIVARITARQREIPSTTTMLAPRGAIPTGAGGRDGEGAGNTGDRREPIMTLVKFLKRDKGGETWWKKTDRHSPRESRWTVPSPCQCTSSHQHQRAANTDALVPSPLLHSSHCTNSTVAMGPKNLPKTKKKG